MATFSKPERYEYQGGLVVLPDARTSGETECTAYFKAPDGTDLEARLVIYHDAEDARLSHWDGAEGRINGHRASLHEILTVFSGTGDADLGQDRFDTLIQPFMEDDWVLWREQSLYLEDLESRHEARNFYRMKGAI